MLLVHRIEQPEQRLGVQRLLVPREDLDQAGLGRIRILKEVQQPIGVEAAPGAEELQNAGGDPGVGVGHACHEKRQRGIVQQLAQEPGDRVGGGGIRERLEQPGHGAIGELPERRQRLPLVRLRGLRGGHERLDCPVDLEPVQHAHPLPSSVARRSWAPPFRNRGRYGVTQAMYALFTMQMFPPAQWTLTNRSSWRLR